MVRLMLIDGGYVILDRNVSLSLSGVYVHI